jgi:hypothetical protein
MNGPALVNPNLATRRLAALPAHAGSGVAFVRPRGCRISLNLEAGIMSRVRGPFYGTPEIRGQSVRGLTMRDGSLKAVRIRCFSFGTGGGASSCRAGASSGAPAPGGPEALLRLPTPNPIERKSAFPLPAVRSTCG